MLKCKEFSDFANIQNCIKNRINKIQIRYSNNCRRNVQMYDKLFEINHNGELFVGVNELSDLALLCTNSILYSSSIMNIQLSVNNNLCCDNTLPSYTRFVLLFSDNKLLNVGFQCKETDRSCDSTCTYSCVNSYITITIY